MDVLDVRSVSKGFGEVQALKDVSFRLPPSEIRAICGENGAGKSTFVKILMGLVEPDSGSISVAGEPVRLRGPQHAQQLGLGLVAQELSLAPRLSILDNIWLGSRDVPLFHRRADLRSRAKAALAELDIGDWDLDQPVSELSLGQRQMVEIARLLARDARVLILDEPTATLTDTEIARMLAALKRLKEKGRSIVYISHRLGEVYQLCDSVTVLRNGEHIATAPVSEMSRDELVEAMLGRALGDMYPEKSPAPAQQERGVEVRALSVPGAVRHFSCIAARGKILCIAGQLGSGASVVTRALSGLLREASGSVTIDGVQFPLGSVSDAVARNVLFISDDRATEGIFHQLQVRENLVASSLARYKRLGLLLRSRIAALAGERAARVGVDKRRLRSRATHLSGGNQQKVLFGRALREAGAGVLVMNEPTRGVDVGARADIYRLMRELCAQGYVLIMSSSDLEEVVGIADEVITMYRGRVVRRYEGQEIDLSRVLADITHPAPTAEVAA